MLTEELKLSCACGELIHQMGNLIADKEIIIGSLTAADGHLLQELGHALRLENYSSNPAGNVEALMAANIDISMMTRTEIVDVADHI